LSKTNTLALIKSISGIRGEIGGKSGQNLTPIDIVECTAAYGHWIMINQGSDKVVIGMDARISGEMVKHLVVNTLTMMGIRVVDLGISTTPTVEIAVPEENAGGGIILTASHNPRQWNALKFLNHLGEFISAEDGQNILKYIKDKAFQFATVDKLGSYVKNESYIEKHVKKIIRLPLVKEDDVRARKFSVVVDCINSSGAKAIPVLLKKLACDFELINEDMTGEFAHNPEPLPQHLTQLMDTVKNSNADLGIVVDPDVDRLAFVCEDGTLFGEEFTLVAIADYILHHKKGNTVSNLSSTRALADVSRSHGVNYFPAAVGEVNVVKLMKEKDAVIGGEGNGGIIYPELHYGRDALVGIALFLSYLAEKNISASALKNTYPKYIIDKQKILLTPELDVDALLASVQEAFKEEKVNTIDGVKIDFKDGWIHLRKSNTEPIIRLYAEAKDQKTIDKLITKVKSAIAPLVQTA